MVDLRPGPDGEQLPPNTFVFRIGKAVHLSPVAIRNGRPLPGMFELSSEEKATIEKRLSVWAEELTVADEAWEIMKKNPANTVVACLNTNVIRTIKPLDVEWECALTENSNGDVVANTLPGAIGHAGIAHLYDDNKIVRKTLRAKLADIANLSPVPVPHNFSNEAIESAETEVMNSSGGSLERSSVRRLAIRLLRRQSVRVHQRQE